MPDWQPNWNDVDFDHGKATAAATECRAAARALRTAVEGLAGLPATDHWTGQYKDDFAADQPGTEADLEGTRDDLTALATRIDGAATDATTEQRSREDDRERWFDELAAETADDEPAPPLPTGPAVPR